MQWPVTKLALRINLSILPSTKGFAANLGKDLDGPFSAAGQRGGDQIGDGVGKSKGFASAGVKAGGLFLAAFAAVGLAQAASAVKDFFTDSIEAGTNLNETTSKTGEIFGDATDQVIAFSKTTAKALGQSQQQALDGAATFGIFGKSAGLAGSDLANFSTGMITLAGDLASFNNTSPEDAINAIGSALRGEAEPIRAYGVLLDDATLKQRALSMGLITTTKEALTPQNKVLAAHAEILAQTTTQQGDFARTSDGLANKQRIFQAELENTKTTIGTALLPVVTDLFGVFSDVGVPALQELATWFTENEDTVRHMAIAFVDSGLLAIQTFLDIGAGAFRLAGLLLLNTQNMTTLWFAFVQSILDGAVTAFGWIPGLGEKLKGAADSFRDLGTKTDETFDAMRAGAEETATMFNEGADAVNLLRDAVAQLDGKKATVFLNAQGNAVTAMATGGFRVKGSDWEARATGGPVRAGNPYIVGEHEAELFVPDRNGQIYNQRQLASASSSTGGGDVYVQNPFTGDYLLAQVDVRATRAIRTAGSGRAR